MANCFYALGVQCGKLACEYQPAPLTLPTELTGADIDDCLEFWEGYQLGWDKQEASTTFFFKIEA